MVLPVDNPTKSYWIEAAESPLRNFGSTEPLPEETDVAIVGSGYAGASTAYWIHKVRAHNNNKGTKLYSMIASLPREHQDSPK
jgi:hypothetical protein